MRNGILGWIVFALVGCSMPNSLKEENKPFQVTLFVAGQVQGSPPLESLVAGLNQLKEELGDSFSLSVLEAGYQQGEWDLKFKKMVVATQADLYIATNPSMRGIVEQVANLYPDKKFMLFESAPLLLPNVVTIDFKSGDLAYLAGVYTASFFQEMYPAFPAYVGILVGQEYPKMELIVERFREGFISLGENNKVSYRVLGNWYDAERSRQIAAQLYQSGVMGMLSIAGLANQGVVQATMENNAYVMFYEADPADPILKEDFVVFAGFVDYKSLAYLLTKEAYEGDLTWGVHHEYGIEEGFLGFLDSTQSLRDHWELVKGDLFTETSREE